MAMGCTRPGGQGVAIDLVSCATVWVLTPMVLGFDSMDIVPFTCIRVPIFSTLRGEAARAGNRIAMTISLVFMVGLLGIGSACALVHSGVHLSAIADVASVRLMSFMVLVVQLTRLR
jgi:hypothetical protein